MLQFRDYGIAEDCSIAGERRALNHIGILHQTGPDTGEVVSYSGTLCAGLRCREGIIVSSPACPRCGAVRRIYRGARYVGRTTKAAKVEIHAAASHQAFSLERRIIRTVQINEAHLL